MRSRHLLALLALVVTAPIGAQTVRGSIVDETRRLPIGDVLVTLLAADGAEASAGVRSDTLGAFVIHTARPGTYRVRATRIGFRQLTSEPVTLGAGGLAVLRLRMTTVAQELVPVRVVERRRLTQSELMSPAGFDLRKTKGLGRFLGSEQLASLGLLGGGELLRAYLRPTVEIGNDGEGDYLYMMRQNHDAMIGGQVRCAPEIFLDGRMMSGSRDSPGQRTAAFAMLEALPAKELYGVEAYRGSQVPPPSVGGSFGLSDLDPSNPCGVVAVWTKNGRLLAGTAPRGNGRSGIQVLRGVVVDFDTGQPVPGVPVTLMGANNAVLSRAVKSDSAGEFTIRTNRVGPLRLESGDIGFHARITPTFHLEPEELVLLKLYVSGRKAIEAPLGIQARLRPESHGVTDLASFAYRRERGIVGAFFSADDIRRRGAGTLSDLVRSVDGVIVTGTAPSDTIALRSTVVGGRRTCSPTFFLNGSRLITGVDSTLRAMPMARIFGVEVYAKPSEVPPIHADAVDECGMIGIWTRDR